MSNNSDQPKRPEGSLYKDFFIDAQPEKVVKSLSEINKQLTRLDERIQTLVERYTVNGSPVLGFMLEYAKDPKELIELAKGLDRAARLVKVKAELTNKRVALTLMKENPTWLMGELNDLTNDVEDIITTALNIPKE